MAVAAKDQSLKSIRVGFYTSSENIRTNNKWLTAEAFNVLYTKCSKDLKMTHHADFGERELKIHFLAVSPEDGSYFGFMSRRRKSATLAYITDTEWVEEKIPLAGAKSLSERTYFIYYPQIDILVLSLNHLGPRHSDLAFLLFNSSTNGTPVSFEAIWKEESIKELLETGSNLRSCEISIAIPRNFNAAQYNLDGMFANQMIEMIKGTSSSHLTLSLRGHSPLKRKAKGWLEDDVKKSLKEMLEKFPGGDGRLTFEKADVVAQGDKKKKSLVDEVLTVRKMVPIQTDGYPIDIDVKNAMLQAKNDNLKYLTQYYLVSQP
ncbi:TPA: hypothetical protein MAZ01_003068 [Klebsiella pneumoniae]|uniref:hypothetical protein n=1 Tax=Klebsiella pneumoniae TaxID=573 RepID=UPI0024073EF4|nr:hypothetical protein [Klebsiella pneumoniae]MDG0621107.1 hypothetical protein [Klebsiella pneumoniae]HBQ6077453.1 hypothetical protein [Klebsiella pneumoniae subsp. pneumoniae]HBR4547059.1 hypothetical protein [Klebsiella pneumoniae]